MRDEILKKTVVRNFTDCTFDLLLLRWLYQEEFSGQVSVLQCELGTQEMQT